MLRSRVLMFTASSLWVALILVVLVFRGGGAVPVEPPPGPAGLPSGQSLASQAAARAALGDYETAWRLYREALEAAPENVSLWYALGVTLSHLDERAGTEAAFRYVVNRGAPDSEEVRVAREWLVSAGVLAPSVAFASAPGPADTTEATAAVKGKIAWPVAERNAAAAKGRILLHGLRGAAEGKRLTARVGQGQTYRFAGLPAGSYRLIGSVGGQRLWDLTVDVEDGKEVILDLTKENAGPSATVALSQ